MDNKERFEKHLAVLEAGDHNAQTAAACIRMHVADLERELEIREWCPSCGNHGTSRCTPCLEAPGNPPKYYRRDA